MMPSLYSAEREGFEPPVPLSTAVFKTAAIDHSAIFPYVSRVRGTVSSPQKSGAKLNVSWEFSKCRGGFYLLGMLIG